MHRSQEGSRAGPHHVRVAMLRAWFQRQGLLPTERTPQSTTSVTSRNKVQLRSGEFDRNCTRSGETGTEQSAPQTAQKQSAPHSTETKCTPPRGDRQNKVHFSRDRHRTSAPQE